MLDNFQQYANQIVDEHNIPAVSLAIWKNGRLYESAAGILNLDTEVNATTDSIFQIGSITKVFTTSLIMKLVEAGRVDLHKPVKHYLRDFQIADRQATESITVQQLLNHTSGIAGDFFPNDINEDGPHIARYVDRCSQIPLVHPVGEGFSYSNSAFAIAGRIIEVVTGMSWFDAMEELIYQPLGMDNAICRPAEALRFRAALGHLANGADPSTLTTCSGSYLCMGLSPAGTTPTMTAADLVTFGRAHLDNGKNRSGTHWLSEESVQLMQTATHDFPSASRSSTNAIALGWMLERHTSSGLRSVSHSGGTNGQCAHLRIFPKQKACIAILLNCANVNALNLIINQMSEAATDSVLERETGTEIDMPNEELEKYAGLYSSHAGDFQITLSENGLTGTFDDAVDEEAQVSFSLSPLGEGCFSKKSHQNVATGLVYFMKPDNQGRPSEFFSGVRLFQRQETIR